jgi:sugar phosphate isomerase/epimerase
MVEAVEVVNGCRSVNNRNDLAARWCQKIGRIALAGSDARSCCEVGEAVTCLPSVPDSSRALGALLRRKQINDVRQRHSLCLGLQTCRYNGLYIEDELRHAARQNMGAFEIFFDGFMPREIDHKARQRFASMAAGMGLRLSVLAPLVPLAGGSGRELLRELVAFSVDVGATLLVVPAGCAVEPPAVAEAVARAREHGIGVAIGNGPDLARNCTPRALADLVLAIPGADAALDVGHAQLQGSAAAYTDELLALLAPTGRRIVHLQLHDNDGRSDGHLSMGDGTVALTAVLKSLFDAGFDGTGIIEHWRDPRREREQILQIVCALARPMALVDVDRLAAGPVPSVPPTL